MQVKQAIKLAHSQVNSYHAQKRSSDTQLVIINALCNLYGSAYIASKWYRLAPIVESGASMGRILSAAIATIKRSM